MRIPQITLTAVIILATRSQFLVKTKLIFKKTAQCCVKFLMKHLKMEELMKI